MQRAQVHGDHRPRIPDSTPRTQPRSRNPQGKTPDHRNREREFGHSLGSWNRERPRPGGRGETRLAPSPSALALLLRRWIGRARLEWGERESTMMPLGLLRILPPPPSVRLPSVIKFSSGARRRELAAQVAAGRVPSPPGSGPAAAATPTTPRVRPRVRYAPLPAAPLGPGARPPMRSPPAHVSAAAGRRAGRCSARSEPDGGCDDPMVRWV